MLGMVFGLRLRQSEGLLSSVLDLVRLDLPVSDHTTLSRRARTWMPSVERRAVPNAPLHVLVESTGLKIYGAGQWLEEKHGAKSRRGWRKLHLAICFIENSSLGSRPTREALTRRLTSDLCAVDRVIRDAIFRFRVRC
jgi:hypothetical protein